MANIIRATTPTIKYTFKHVDVSDITKAYMTIMTSTYTKCVSLTCSKAGTYDVYWSTFRSSTSGTSGSQLYVDGSAYGTADTTTWSNHIQNMHLTGVSIGASEEVAVYARSRGNNYYSYVGTLTIIQTA